MRDVAARQPRRTQWMDLDLPFVARLVADDLDENEREHNQIWKQLASTNRLLIGILVSTTTASILLAANIVLGSL
jgi:hypothetical protein